MNGENFVAFFISIPKFGVIFVFQFQILRQNVEFEANFYTNKKTCQVLKT